MDLTLLRTFVAVHRAGSFTRAAQLLGLSQPAVTGQIRSLERQIGRPLFLRLPRGVAPTTVGDELAHKVAPHLDALSEITEADLGADAVRTLHLAGPRDFTSARVLPALAVLVADGLGLRVSLGRDEENLNGLAAAHYDLVVATSRPRGRLFTATPLCDEEDVLVASPSWGERLDPAVAEGGPGVLEGAPVIDFDEDLPFVSRYWSAVFDTKPSVAGSVVVPDLRAVLHTVRAGAGVAVLPSYLCRDDLAAGGLVALLEPAVPPLRTFFLVTRIGTLTQPHIALGHERLLRAAAEW
ncbi:LysR family transcriptional regulator [Wenjunlia tyrosinilytica]|uniref:LysR family transcriptional regulator n=1 Tax=Wenjunlia tyrosinilytica TaxID=1544741 RepID=A0A917ZMJ2_9ACTN|nr:LysR family transcriptional regulator [Wenjunlia tyrosinilytica]GGO86331.1 LysR family transcriptional regulator [Wenjunlia tyrosinilytica]